MPDRTPFAAQGHRDAELTEPRDLSTQRLAEIAFECLNAHGASLRMEKSDRTPSAAQTRVTIGPSPFVAWLGWTWTLSRYGRTIQWP